MILSKLSANYLGAISNIFLKIHKIFFNTIPAPWVLILKGGNWLLIGHLLEVLLKSKIISIQIFYGRIFLSFLNEWILYSSDSKHHIWPCHCLRHHWIRLQKIFLRFLISSSALQACWCCFDLNFSVGYKLGRGSWGGALRHSVLLAVRQGLWPLLSNRSAQLKQGDAWAWL